MCKELVGGKVRRLTGKEVKALDRKMGMNRDKLKKRIMSGRTQTSRVVWWEFGKRAAKCGKEKKSSRKS